MKINILVLFMQGNVLNITQVHQPYTEVQRSLEMKRKTSIIASCSYNVNHEILVLDQVSSAHQLASLQDNGDFLR